MAIVSLSVILGVSVSPAVAKTKQYPTRSYVSAGVQYSGPGFQNRDVVSSVYSPKPSCRFHRKIKLLYFGTSGSDPVTVVGSAKTDRYGTFVIHYVSADPAEVGRYRFKVAEKKLSHQRRCRPARSPRFTI